MGAALALRDTGRLPVCVGGDGDFLMGVTAIWTAVHYRIPLLYIVANNQSFFNDEVHQERVARMRGRPVENKWIGMRMDDPEIDIAGIGAAQGAAGFGPVRRSLVEAQPWLPMAVLKAFTRSKAVALDHLADTSASKITLPFVEEQLRRAVGLMGADFWPYGVGPNRHVLDYFLDAHHRQGLSARRVAIEELFHPATLESYVI